MRETGGLDDKERIADPERAENMARKLRIANANIALSGCAGDRRLPLRCLRASLVIAALGSTSLFGSAAEAQTCLASADEVRKLAPGTWPRWTYGPNRERCWYSGKKPVFAKAPLSQPELPRVPVPRTTTETPTHEDSGTPQPIKQPWALEHRWSGTFELRHQARDEPLSYWVGEDDGYDSYGVDRPLGRNH
jgi:hypothetical protein